MIPELGHYALITALWLALAQAALLFAPVQRSNLIRPAAIAQWFAVTLSFGCLIFSFATSDFSVSSVVEHSHSAKPLIYKITASWGYHEGSMLLWVWVLSFYGFMFSRRRHPESAQLQETTLGIQGLLSAGFLLFILLTSNPFTRIFPPASNGQDLNPLLQDIGLAIHPPMLYLGYVGFSLVFSLATAGLANKSFNRRWASLAQPWILIAWSALTLGIGLGSWWAYRELGWGGWWFWDPVENASLMPWLAGTALLHANLVYARRGTLARWVALLAIMTFSLSLLGTFLVRSGVLTSVHSFASDPKRGLFILGYMVLAIGGGLLLYTLRAGTLHSHKDGMTPISREGSIVVNNLFLVTACLAILLATLYPMFLEWLASEKISMGPPYFQRTVVPILAPVIFLAGIGPLLSWRKGKLANLSRSLQLPLIAGLLTAFITLYCAPPHPLLSATGLGLSAWLAASTLAAIATRTHFFSARSREVRQRLRSLPASYYGMIAAHLGVAIIIAGITASSLWQVEKDKQMKMGSTITNIGPFRATFDGQQNGMGPNYMTQQGIVQITRNKHNITTLTPELRFYPVRETETSESSIYTTFIYDLYAVLGKSDGPGARLRMYYTPLMNWVWAGFICMAAGGLLSLLTYQRGAKT